MKHALLHDGLQYWRRQTPDKPAVVLDDADRLTYEELARWSDGVAARLQGLGVAEGDNVAVTGANSLEWIAAAFGILKAGAVIVPYNERFVAAEMAYLIERTEPRVIVADRARSEVIRSLNIDVPLLSMEALKRDRAGAPEGWSPVRVAAEAPAMIIFTSGTTDRPKGVVLSHGQHLAKYFEMMLVDPDLGPDTRALSPLALQSAPGTAWGYLMTTTVGGTLHFTRKFDAERTLKTLAEQTITLFMGMPVVYQQICRLPGFAAADLSALKFARAGGARLPEDVLALWRGKGVALRSLYGMTEMGGGVIVATEEETLARPHACGRGTPYSRIRVVREDGLDCAANEPGEVLLQGPGMMVGYWRDPEATAKAVVDGWMVSGDIGLFDEEGYFFFVDRAKDMIKSGGFNISPSDVERVILQAPGVLEAAVFAVADERFGEVPCACVHAAPPPEPDALFAWCRERLAGFKLPRYVIPLETSLPRLSSGKIDKRSLKIKHADAPSRHPRLG